MLFLMAILKCLMLLFIIFCVCLPTQGYDKSLTEIEGEDHHDISEHCCSVEQCKNEISLSEGNGPAVPEIVPLPVEFPDLTVSSQLISINVSEEVSVKDLLIEIGKLSDINLDINPKISGNIILKLKDKNINEVIQSIADSAKLRYSTSNGVIKIEQDLPYAQNYYVDFINIQHSAQSSFIVNNNITSGNRGNADEDCNSVIKSQYSSDLWNSLEKGLNAIMDINGVDNKEFLSSNRETGVIILNARKSIHKAVEEYINKVKQLASSQVMIEAKIVEVVLDDKYLSGINLNDLCNVNKPVVNQDNSIIDLAVNFGASDLGNLVKSLDKFGTSTIISSPRVHAINN